MNARNQLHYSAPIFQHLGCGLILLFALLAPGENSATAGNANPLGLEAMVGETHFLTHNSSSRNTGYHDPATKKFGRCSECHNFDPLFSHPVGVLPPASMQVPEHLPLIKGRVTCVTCHAGVSTDHNTNALQDEMGYGLCNQCHTSGFTARNMHASSTNRAHLPQAERDSRSSRHIVGQSSDGLDTESDSCMSCHDGAIAGGAGSFNTTNHGYLFGSTSSDHPIGAYELTDPYDSDGPLKPASSLDSRIRLFNNNVGCGSCHSIYSREKNLLVMSNLGSKLCLGCHEY